VGTSLRGSDQRVEPMATPVQPTDWQALSVRHTCWYLEALLMLLQRYLAHAAYAVLSIVCLPVDMSSA